MLYILYDVIRILYATSSLAAVTDIYHVDQAEVVTFRVRNNNIVAAQAPIPDSCSVHEKYLKSYLI